MNTIRKSGAKYSAIIGIGEQLRNASLNENTEYLMLNRGINAVVNLDLHEIVPKIDFNSNDIQVYPPVKGRLKLRQAINNNFFNGRASENDIYITNGGTGALELIFKTLAVKKIMVPDLYWGSYLNMMKINRIEFGFYPDLAWLRSNINELSGSAVIICDPNNPSGAKYDDNELIETIDYLNKTGVFTIIDSPYRRLFVNWKTDNFFSEFIGFENVVICESFSKSIGLSGQRIGFIHSSNKELMEELAINLLYATNGVNNFAQILVELILSTPEGEKAAEKFRNQTTKAIAGNIGFLQRKNLLADEFYKGNTPWGIFTIVNKSFENLLQYKIGSVPLKYFCQLPEHLAQAYSRICVSVDPLKFSRFFDNLK
ncbi:MAG: pyridoxal phosphate-dependent aminotransferase [Bacteroidales bacterium]